MRHRAIPRQNTNLCRFMFNLQALIARNRIILNISCVLTEHHTGEGKSGQRTFSVWRSQMCAVRFSSEAVGQGVHARRVEGSHRGTPRSFDEPFFASNRRFSSSRHFWTCSRSSGSLRWLSLRSHSSISPNSFGPPMAASVFAAA